MVDPDRIRAKLTSLRTYRARLGEHDTIDLDLAERLMDLSGLRNRLVHLYDDVDDHLVHQAISDGIGDFDQFAAAIAGLVTD